MHASTTSRRLRHFLASLCFLVLVFGIGGCGSSPEASYPSDQSLINTFQANQAAFAKLVSNPEDKALHAQLGIRRVLSNTANPKHVMFEVWFHDFPGPGGATKGYSYMEKAPPADRLVESIDKLTNPPISPEEKSLSRRIQGNWYLYFHSSH
jgi:hypothetical protein